MIDECMIREISIDKLSDTVHTTDSNCYGNPNLRKQNNTNEPI